MNKMKRILLFLSLTTLILGSCTSSVRSTQGTRNIGKVIKGEWVLSSVTYNQQGKYNITLLKDTSKECFEGSHWKFVPNNSRGIYNINKIGCAGGDRHFVFVIQEIDPTTGYYDFLLKPTNPKYQSETNEGVRLRLAHLSDNQMSWEQTLKVDGKPFVISMNFNKQ